METRFLLAMDVAKLLDCPHRMFESSSRAENCERIKLPPASGFLTAPTSIDSQPSAKVEMQSKAKACHGMARVGRVGKWAEGFYVHNSFRPHPDCTLLR